MSETVGSEVVSQEGFNLTNAAECRKEICLDDSGSPQHTVDEIEAAKVSSFNKEQ